MKLKLNKEKRYFPAVVYEIVHIVEKPEYKHEDLIYESKYLNDIEHFIENRLVPFLERMPHYSIEGIVVKQVTITPIISVVDIIN